MHTRTLYHLIWFHGYNLIEIHVLASVQLSHRLFQLVKLLKQNKLGSSSEQLAHALYLWAASCQMLCVDKQMVCQYYVKMTSLVFYISNACFCCFLMIAFYIYSFMACLGKNTVFCLCWYLKESFSVYCENDLPYDLRMFTQ